MGIGNQTVLSIDAADLARWRKGGFGKNGFLSEEEVELVESEHPDMKGVLVPKDLKTCNLTDDYVRTNLINSSSCIALHALYSSEEGEDSTRDPGTALASCIVASSPKQNITSLYDRSVQASESARFGAFTPLRNLAGIS